LLSEFHTTFPFAWLQAMARRLGAALLHTALALGCTGALAIGATSISPVMVDVPVQGRAIVTVRNDHAREMLYQVNILNWQLAEGADVYTNSQDFIASPPLFTLAPHASQVVRIGFRSPVHHPVEQAYRLVLAEVPRPGSASEGAGVVEFALQYLVPVFVAPTRREAQPSLTWSLRADGDAWVVRADNTGDRRMALDGVGLVRGTATEPEKVNWQRHTVLARSWREWRFQGPHQAEDGPWRVVMFPSGGTRPVIVPDMDMRTFSPR
jgi:fimbrial chaperone protein